MADISHGGNLSDAIEKYGGERKDWLDLSTGISPFSPKLPDFDQEIWRRLPEAATERKVQSLAKQFYKSNLDCLIVPGTQFVIQNLPRILDGKTGIVGPTYGEYGHAFDQQNADFQMIDGIEDIGDLKSIILVNPNNPDGRSYSPDQLLELAFELSERDGYLVVDEAFADMSGANNSLMNNQKADNILILRSFGKFYGLAGLRLGLVFGPQQLLSKISALKGPWSVSGPALAVADYIYSRPEISSELYQKIDKRFKEMKRAFDKMNLEIVGHTQLSFLLAFPSAEKMHKHLQRKQILTRKFDYNQKWLRIGLTLNEEQDQRLIDAINEFTG